MKNLKLFNDKYDSRFGGSLLKNSHAKTARPWSPKAFMHVVLKANAYKLRTNSRIVEKIIERQAKKHFIQIQFIENVGNHIHLVIRSKDKTKFQNFLRAICGLIAKTRKVTWLQRPFSCIVRWGKQYATLRDYMKINRYESQGYLRNQARFMVDFDNGLIEEAFSP